MLELVRRSRSEQNEHEYRVSSAKKQAHRKFARDEDVLDPRLECRLGRMAFRGIISIAEYEAGVRFRNCAMSYLQTIGAPYPFVQSVEGDSLVTGPMEMPEDEVCERAKREYFAARKAIARVGGLRVQRAVDAVVACEDQYWVDDVYGLECLRKGLRALVRHYEPRSTHPFRTV